MRLTDFNPIIKESLAAWEMFRRMGFPAKDIYIAMGKTGTGDNVSVSIEVHQETLRASVRIGTTFMHRNTILRDWDEAAKIWNDDETSSLERDELWEPSNARADGVMIMLRLHNLGFTINGSEPISRSMHDASLEGKRVMSGFPNAQSHTKEKK